MFSQWQIAVFSAFIHLLILSPSKWIPYLWTNRNQKGQDRQGIFGWTSSPFSEKN